MRTVDTNVRHPDKTIDLELSGRIDAIAPMEGGERLTVEIDRETLLQLLEKAERKLIGLGAAARLLGVSKQRANELLRRQDAPASVLLSGHRVWRETEILAYAARRNTAPGRPKAG